MNMATQPPNYFINGQQRHSTANSANLNYPPTLRLRSLQPDQPRTLPNGGFNSHDLSWLHNTGYSLFSTVYEDGPNCNFSQLSMENATEIDGSECIHITCTWEIYS